VYLEVIFVVEAESLEQFVAEFDEDAVAAALPGPAWLMSFEERRRSPPPFGTNGGSSAAPHELAAAAR
jgi:hypothetical protein